MGFSYKKLTTLRPQKEQKLATFLTALLTAALLFLPYQFLGHGYFLFYGDFNVQQVPFYKMCHAMIRSGNIGWNWLTDLGVNFIGSYSFYLLGSPFFWLTIPFPNAWVPYLMGPLLILKFACAALTAYCYLRRFTQSAQTAKLGGLLYAFSGFSVYNIFFNHFHEAIICFPLLLLGMELLLTENKRGVFAAAVFLCAFVNYFFFFGMVVFAVLYWIVRLLSGCYSLRLSRFFVLLFEAVLGVALAAVLLLPSYRALIGNSRLSEINLGWSAILYGKEQIYPNVLECFFFPPDLPARPVFFPEANVKWSSLGGWLPVFSMVGVLAWFQAKKGHWLRRLIGISAFMALVPILNSAFYAFNQAYYARWFYMPILMLCLATAMAIEDRSVEWKSAFHWVAGITLAVSLVIGFFPSYQTDESGKRTSLRFGLYTNSDSAMYLVRFWTTCAIALGGLLLLWLLLSRLRTNRAQFYRTATVSVCVLSLLYSAVFVGTGKTHSYSVEDVMIPQLIEGHVDLPDDPDNYRIDVYSGVDNTGMFLGLSSINAFHSIVPTSVTDFWEYVGEERGVASRPSTDSYAARSLLGVKYLLNRTNGDDFLENREPRMPGFTYRSTSGGYYVYENENYIPYGFTYDAYMTRAQCDAYTDGYRANLMLKAILLDDEQVNRYGDLLPNLFDAGTTLPDGTVGEYIPDMTAEAYAADCAARAASAADGFERDNGGFTSTITLSQDNLVFYAVPYDEGWTATVNGVPAEIEKVNVGFMAVRAPAGRNRIRFEYRTPGLLTGLSITGGAAVVFLLYCIICAVWLKNRRTVEEYPEGNELLCLWQENEAEDARAALAREMEEQFPQPPNAASGAPSAAKPAGSGFHGGFQVRLDLSEPPAPTPPDDPADGNPPPQ